MSHKNGSRAIAFPNGSVSVYGDTVEEISNGNSPSSSHQQSTSRSESPEDQEAQLPQLLDQLRELLKEYPECKRHDDEFLSKFLRVKDYNVMRALQGIRAFYRHTQRSHHIIDGIRPSHFRSLYDAQIMCVLSSRCSRGTQVSVFRLGAWDPSHHSLHQILQASVLLYQQAIQDKQVQLGGTTIIFDLKGLSLSHVRQITPSSLRHLVFAAQEGLPIKLVALHFINYPALFWGLYYVAQGFMKQKLRERIHFHKDLDSLHGQFRRDMLPKELGGLLAMEDVLDNDLMEKLLRYNRDYTHYY